MRLAHAAKHAGRSAHAAGQVAKEAAQALSKKERDAQHAPQNKRIKPQRRGAPAALCVDAIRRPSRALKREGKLSVRAPHVAEALPVALEALGALEARAARVRSSEDLRCEEGHGAMAADTGAVDR